MWGRSENMPYWFEIAKLRVGKERDKRRVLTDAQIEKIIFLRNSGVSIRKLAKMFKVDRNTIKWHTDANFKRRYYEKVRKLNWKYEKEKHKIVMKNYREHLKEIYGLKRMYE